MERREYPIELNASRTARAVYASLGMLCVALGFLGIFLPLVPTTVFILIAAACFSRSSPRFYAWLMNHAAFGPMIRSWRTHRSIPARAKRLAIGIIAVTFGVSIVLIADTWTLRVMLALLGIVIAAFILRIPSLPDSIEP